MMVNDQFNYLGSSDKSWLIESSSEAIGCKGGEIGEHPTASEVVGGEGEDVSNETSENIL